jgi:hypothetical protein
MPNQRIAKGIRTTFGIELRAFKSEPTVIFTQGFLPDRMPSQTPRHKPRVYPSANLQKLLLRLLKSSPDLIISTRAGITLVGGGKRFSRYKPLRDNNSQPIIKNIKVKNFRSRF